MEGALLATVITSALRRGQGSCQPRLRGRQAWICSCLLRVTRVDFMALCAQWDSTIIRPKVLVSAFPIHATGAMGRTLELIINQTADGMTPFVFCIYSLSVLGTGSRVLSKLNSQSIKELHLLIVKRHSRCFTQS